MKDMIISVLSGKTEYGNIATQLDFHPKQFFHTPTVILLTIFK